MRNVPAVSPAPPLPGGCVGGSERSGGRTASVSSPLRGGQAAMFEFCRAQVRSVIGCLSSWGVGEGQRAAALTPRSCRGDGCSSCGAKGHVGIGD